MPVHLTILVPARQIHLATKLFEIVTRGNMAKMVHYYSAVLLVIDLEYFVVCFVQQNKFEARKPSLMTSLSFAYNNGIKLGS